MRRIQSYLSFALLLGVAVVAVVVGKAGSLLTVVSNWLLDHDWWFEKYLDSDGFPL